MSANSTFMFAPGRHQSGLDNGSTSGSAGSPSARAVFRRPARGRPSTSSSREQLESLQDGDRFYYLQRTDGLNLRSRLEGNSLAELARRNTDLEGTMDVIFNTADVNLNVADFTGTAPVNLGEGMSLLTMADGTKLFFDPFHRGKNIVFNGSASNDRMQADIGDDSIFGNGGNDRIVGGEGNDTLNGGDGDDVSSATTATTSSKAVPATTR